MPPIISRRADKTETKNNLPTGRLGASFRFNREDCCELPILGLRIRSTRSTASAASPSRRGEAPQARPRRDHAGRAGAHRRRRLRVLHRVDGNPVVPPDERHARHPHPVGRPLRPLRRGPAGRDRALVLLDGLRLPSPRLLDARGSIRGAARLPGGARARAALRLLGSRPLLRIHQRRPSGHRMAHAPAVPQRLVLRPGRSPVRPGHFLLRVRPARAQGARLLPHDRHRYRAGRRPRRVLPVRDDPPGPAPPRLQARATPDRPHGRHPLGVHRHQLLAGPLRAADLGERLHPRRHVLRHQRHAPRALDPGGHLLPGCRPLRGGRVPRHVAPARDRRGRHRHRRPDPGRRIPRAHRAVPRAPQPAHPRIALHSAQHRRDPGRLRPRRRRLPDELRRGHHGLGRAIRQRSPHLSGAPARPEGHHQDRPAAPTVPPVLRLQLGHEGRPLHGGRRAARHRHLRARAQPLGPVRRAADVGQPAHRLHARLRRGRSLR